MSLTDRGIVNLKATGKQHKQAAQEIVFNTFEIIAREWHDKFKERWTAKNANAILGRMERDVSAPQLLDIARRIEAQGAAEFLPERRKMMQAWSDYLDGLRAEAGLSV